MLNSRTIGFTLIELLVVMVIISFALGLVLPLTVDQVDKTKARAERELISRIFKQAKNDSYFINKPVQITVLGRKLTYVQGKRAKEWEFSFASFSEQSVKVTQYGFSVSYVDAAVAGKNWRLDLNEKNIGWSDAD